MEGDSEKTKISCFHQWINREGMGHIESWKNSKTLISQSAYDELENQEGKYSSELIESYFTLFELLLAPKSNPLLAVEELHFAKQGSMTSGVKLQKDASSQIKRQKKELSGMQSFWV